jgi:hypothetical protein
MALDDYLEPEVAVAVAVTAAVASPSVRKVLRKGIVYGLAGLLVAKDRAVTVAQGIAEGARQAASTEKSAQTTSTGAAPDPVTT